MKHRYFKLRGFVRESNRIEGIHREPTFAELDECNRFLSLEKPTVHDMVQFVTVYQPGARLRDLPGLDVRVGDYTPPKGHPEIADMLDDIVDAAERTPESAYLMHVTFERVHPFTDCNGRAGRMLWLWQMQVAPRGFLHEWYYQSLRYGHQ